MRTINVIMILCALIRITALATFYFPLIVIGFLGIGVAYCGCPTIGASYIRTYFGQKDYPINLSITNLSLLVASFFGTLAGVLYDISGSHMTTFFVLAVCALVALVVTLAIKKPRTCKQQHL